MSQLLSITAKCEENDRCIYDGKDIFLLINITNIHDVKIGFPLNFLRKTGPIVRLIDNHTKTDSYARTNLADFDLREKLTIIQPGESVSIKWIITSHELEQFSNYKDGTRFDKPYVDVTAKITIKTDIQVNGATVEFINTVPLVIIATKTMRQVIDTPN